VLNFLRQLGQNRHQSTDEVDVAEARRRQEAGALLIDVREPDEWTSGHASGAQHIPLGQLGRHLGKIPRDREVLFICRSGRRSATATAEARRVGLSNALNVRGGTLAWVQAGLPVERGG
jgi:rhodanese-related sulfurtransferase